MLLNSPKPFLDESIRGYFWRCAEANIYEEPMWIYKLAKWNRYNKTVNLLFPDEVYDFTAASAVLKLDEVEIKKMILGYRFSSQYDFFSEKQKQMFKQFGSCAWKPRICPKCIEEKQVHNIYWELALFTSCPLHHCLLVDVCEKCEKLINPLKLNVFKCSCGFEYRHSKVLNVNGELSNYLAKYLLSNSGFHFGEIKELSIENLYYLLLYMVRWANVSNGKMVGFSSQPLKSKQLYEACEKVLYYLQDWPNHFYHYIDELRLIKRDLRGNAPHFITSLFCNPFKGVKGLEFIENTIDYYVVHFWKSGYSNRQNTDEQLIVKSRKINLIKKTTLTGKDMSKILNISLSQAIKIIRKGVIEGEIHERKGNFSYNVTKVALKEFLQTIEQQTEIVENSSIITFEKCFLKAYNYGFDIAGFLILIRNGTIKPCLINPKEKGIKRLCFDNNSVDEKLLQGYMDVKTIAKNMDVKKNAVLKLIQRGYIKVFKKIKTGRQFISLDEYRNFQKSYVFAIHIIREKRIVFNSVGKMLRELAKVEIFPLNIDKKQDEMYVLERTDKLNQFIQDHTKENNQFENRKEKNIVSTSTQNYT